MLNNKKSVLRLAVASASVAMALDASAANFLVTSPDDSGANTLRQAILDSVSGDIITIDNNTVHTITLATSLVSVDKALIISAPVDATGKPQVTIRASDEGYRLLTLTTDGEADPLAPVPFVVSGLAFTGAASDDPGGAISAEYHALVVDKSIISGNKAIGFGGGIAVVGGELCLQGSELSGNTVEAATGNQGSYAIGGGAAVNGILNVVPSFRDGDYNQGALNCLVSTPAQTLFGVVSAEFSAAAAELDGNPDGVDLIGSSITGNLALNEADVSLEYTKYLALGGGLAVVESNFDQTESVLLEGACDSSSPAKYNEAEQCSVIVASSVTGNEARLVSTAGEHAASYSIVSGGGVFIGAPGVELGLTVSTKYSDISGNTATLEGSRSINGDIVVGAGIGALNSELIAEVSDFLNTGSVEGGSACVGENSIKYCGIKVTVGASTVTGNTATLDTDLYDGLDNAINLIVGGGIGAINLAKYSSEEVDKLYTTASVQSFFSVISGNHIDALGVGDTTGASGAGVGAGTAVLDGPSEIAINLAYGKYLGFFSGTSDNGLTVTGAADETVDGLFAGGGVNAAGLVIIGEKPEFEIISDEESEVKYGIPAFEALFTSPGGITNNAIQVTTTGGELSGVVVGGGAASAGNYSIQVTAGASITGNAITVNSATSGGNSVVGGGGAAVVPLVNVDETTMLSWSKYSEVKDNSITVTAGPDLQIGAAGGGLVVGPFWGEDDGGAIFAMSRSEVSGNTIDLTSDHADSEAIGGGIAAVTASGFTNGEPNGKYSSGNIINSTIANNSLTISGAGDVAGAGVFLDVKYFEDDVIGSGGILNATIAGNTGSHNNGESHGGQVALYGGEGGAESGFRLHNTIITGATAQGEDGDLYADLLVLDVAATAVRFGPNVLPEGFLSPEIADPTFLGELQFNGSDVAGSDDKYGFSPATATIALLPDSGAINPTVEGACISVEGETSGPDQRSYPRDECPDLGAYERGAEQDGDGLVDDDELDAAATNPDILAELANYPPPYGILLASGDGNSDGFADVDQSYVASFTSETAGPLTLYVTDSNPDDLSAVVPVPGKMAGGFDLSLGGVSFTVLTGNGTDSVELSLIAPAIDGVSLSLVKQICNPLQEAPAPGPDEGWEILDDSPEPFDEGRVRFTFVLEPEGQFDCNGAEQDIEDPVYIAQSRATSIPSMPAILYGLLSGAIGLVGLFGLGSRKKKPAS